MPRHPIFYTRVKQQNDCFSYFIGYRSTPPPSRKWYHWYDERKNEKKRCVKWLQRTIHISKSISSNIKHFTSQQKKKAEKNPETGLGLFFRRIFLIQLLLLLSKWRALWGFLLLFVNRPSVLLNRGPGGPIFIPILWILLVLYSNIYELIYFDD